MSICIAEEEYRWKAEDFGIVTWSKYSPIEEAFRAVEFGIFFGYPLCCILEYAFDVIDKRHSFVRRGNVPSGFGGRYVPCSKCCEEMGREYAA